MKYFGKGRTRSNAGVPDGRGLVTDAQALNQGFVPFRIMAFQVFQKATPPGNHRQQTPAGMMVLLVSLEMIVEVGNPLTQNRYLNFWRPGVSLVGLVLGDNALLNISRQCHYRIDTPRLTLISFILC
ncbi:MAG TPA: hypothetical protein VKU01_20315 [Bryobacteraceae bacterium]|nr:hypothetical protein [Bryobacteraceae bacterium]